MDSPWLTHSPCKEEQRENGENCSTLDTEITRVLTGGQYRSKSVGARQKQTVKGGVGFKGVSLRAEYLRMLAKCGMKFNKSECSKPIITY